MFKVTIKGKTMDELRSNVAAFLAGTEDSIQVKHSGQALESFAAMLPEESEIKPFKPTMLVSTDHAPAKIPSAAAMNDFGVDSRGIPWDERIHSVTQAKLESGAWRYKRGVEKSYIKTIEDELAARGNSSPSATVQDRGLSPSPVLAPAIPQALTPSPFVAPPIPIVQPVPVVAVQAPVAPPMPPPQPAVPSAHSFKTFKETLIPTLAKLVRDGKLTQEYVSQLCEHYKVDMIHKVNDVQLEEMFNNFVQYQMIVKAE